MKYKVIYDIEGFPIKKHEGGMYAFMPYERLDKKNKAMFKVGLASNLDRRFESHMTDYPAGFYYKNLLVSPTIHKKDFEIKGRVTPDMREAKKKTAQVKYYKKIEKYIFKDIEKHGGKRYKSTTRVTNPDAEGKGESEWFYTDEPTLDHAFKLAHKEFGGRNLDNNLLHINQEANKNKKGATYTAEIYYHV